MRPTSRARACRRARRASRAPRPSRSAQTFRGTDRAWSWETARSPRRRHWQPADRPVRARHRLLHAAVHRLRVGDVGDDIAAASPCPTTSASDFSLRPAMVTAAPACDQRRRNGAADAASAASHQSVPSLQRSHEIASCARNTLSLNFSGFKYLKGLWRMPKNSQRSFRGTEGANPNPEARSGTFRIPGSALGAVPE